MLNDSINSSILKNAYFGVGGSYRVTYKLKTLLNWSFFLSYFCLACVITGQSETSLSLSQVATDDGAQFECVHYPCISWIGKFADKIEFHVTKKTNQEIDWVFNFENFPRAVDVWNFKYFGIATFGTQTNLALGKSLNKVAARCKCYAVV